MEALKYKSLYNYEKILGQCEHQIVKLKMYSNKTELYVQVRLFTLPEDVLLGVVTPDPSPADNVCFIKIQCMLDHLWY